jgi:4-amino-4-deoxy-L-arabinose transferase-like glycosyltransferase
MFLIGRELFSKRVGLIAAFLYALYLPIAFLSTFPLHDALMPFITLVSLYFFIKAVRMQAIRFYILSGFFAGVGCYFQPSTQFLPVMYGMGLFIYGLRKSDFRKHILNVAKVTAIMMAVLVLVTSPWVVRNYNITGVANMRPPGSWQGIWEGFGEFENPVGAVLSDEHADQLAKQALGDDVQLGSAETNAYFRGKVLSTIRKYPSWYLGLVARRVPSAIFYTSELGINLILRDVDYQNPTITEIVGMIRNDTFWEFVREHPFATGYRIMVYAFAIVPVLLSVAAFWVMRRNWRPMVLVATIPVYFAAIHIAIMVASYKSIVPASLGYIIFSAIALDYIYRRIRGADSRTDELATPPTENHPKKGFLSWACLSCWSPCFLCSYSKKTLVFCVG